MAQAFPQSLNISNLKRKSVAVRNYRINVSADNGSSFGPSSTIKFNLPQLPRSYIDPQAMALRIKVTSTDATPSTHLDKSAHSLISRITQTCGGSVLSDVSEYNVLTAMLQDLQTQQLQAQSDGVLTIGMGGDLDARLQGVEIDNNAKYFVIPLWCGINSAERLVSLDTSSPISYTFYLESALNCLRSAGTAAQGAAIANYTVQEAELIGYVSEISQESQVLLQQSLGSLGFNVFYEDWTHISQTAAQGTTKSVFNLALRYSALSQLLFCMRNSTNLNNGNQFSISARSYGTLQNYSLTVGGQKMPSTGVRVGANNFGEVVSELGLSFGLFNDIVNPHSLNQIDMSNGTTTNLFAVPNGTIATDGGNGTHAHDASKAGSFCAGLDLDGFKSGELNGIYSGMNTQSASMSVNCDYTSLPAAMTFSFFGKFQCILSLDEVTGAYVSSV
ncbi:MAG: hypothetical protein ACR2ON_03325 [Paracoccaceae bacterium]